MFIAHLPAGYLLAKTIRLRTPGRKAVMTAALLGAIAPDLDLFYFYTLDGRQHHHHSYWTHYPSVWFALMLLAWGASRIKPWSTGGTWLLIFSMSGFLHLLLDFIVGDIPLLGELFRNRTTQKIHTEVAMIVIPYLLDVPASGVSSRSILLTP